MKAGRGTTRLVSSQISEETLKRDLEEYRRQAIELGASDAMVIPAEWVEVDERVRLKCLVGRCYNYGQSAHCPPYTPDPDFMRKAFSRFQWAVLLQRNVVPVEDYADISRYPAEGIKKDIDFLSIVTKIESLAFADGYYLAMGFGCGSCHSSLCGDMLCAVLDGGRCRFPLRARPSMEAVGIDVFGLVAKVGWQICPIYRSVNPELVPCANSIGLVFVY